MHIKKQFRSRLHELNTSQIIALGFAGVIFIGGLILWLPFCAAPGQTTSFSDAMFTAATSVCVTGLVTVTTATHWSLAGKIVILLLIQIGGIGLIALASLIFIGLRKKISLRNRRIIQESYNLDKMGGMVNVVRRVLFCVFGAEAIGAVCYSFCFIPEYGVLKGIWKSVFTAVSAFCNAGIDLFGDNSLAGYAENPLVNFTTMGLIIMAGLGFTVWWDLWGNIRKVFKGKMPLRRVYKCLRLHSKIVLAMTGILIFGGAFLIFVFDFNNPDSLGTLPLGSKLMAALFQSVTTRTAGFFTIAQDKFSSASVLICLFLMFVGGSPMGTAGGVKTTSLAVMLLSLKSSLLGKRDVEACNRRIREGYLRSAMVVVCMGFGALFFMTMLLCAAMPGASFVDVIYEMTSAIATVGLSRGLTPNLNTVGKWIVIITMYLGRIGPLTLGAAVVVRAQKRPDNSHLAEEDVMIG